MWARDTKTSVFHRSFLGVDAPADLGRERPRNRGTGIAFVADA